MRLTHVLETHVHNNCVSGGLALSQVTGAAYVVPARCHVEFPHVPASDGDLLITGDMRIGALHTAGHSHHHTSYCLADADGQIQAVFTGGSMLYGFTRDAGCCGDPDREEVEDDVGDSADDSGDVDAAEGVHARAGVVGLGDDRELRGDGEDEGGQPWPQDPAVPPGGVEKDGTSSSPRWMK